MKCLFCAAEASERCSWPVIKTMPKQADHVYAGDTWISPDTKRRCAVLSVKHVPLEDHNGWKFPPRVEILVRFPRPRGRNEPPEHTYMRKPDAIVEVLGEGFCEADVCEFHQRDVGGIFYCQQHWHAWEAVA